MSRFDIYDWLPLFGVLFVTAILLNTIFPNRSHSSALLHPPLPTPCPCPSYVTTHHLHLHSLFLAGQQLSLGRKEGRADTDPLDMAINQLENGVLMLSAIRWARDIRWLIPIMNPGTEAAARRDWPASSGRWGGRCRTGTPSWRQSTCSSQTNTPTLPPVLSRSG